MVKAIGCQKKEFNSALPVAKVIPIEQLLKRINKAATKGGKDTGKKTIVEPVIRPKKHDFL